jgi:hypothetical protein
MRQSGGVRLLTPPPILENLRGRGTDMGGYGSGRPREKRTVEECRILSASDFGRGGILRDGLNTRGKLNWTNTRTGKQVFSIDCEADTRDRGDAWIRLNHMPACRGDAVDYRIRLTTTAMPWGGVHWWFTCPLSHHGRACQRRCWKLYLPPGARYFGCRSCYNLTYASSQEAHKYDEIYGLLAARLGGSPAMIKHVMKMMM